MFRSRKKWPTDSPVPRGKHARAMKSRQAEAETFMINIFHATEDQYGIPLVLLDAYADAVERYHLQDWRNSEGESTAGEMNARARAQYERLTDSIPAYTLEGGKDRWADFEQALNDFVVAGSWAISTAQEALHGSNVGFSEHTDPAFAGLVEGDDQ